MQMNQDDTREMKIISEPYQGSDEWLRVRKTKITATDARVIMGTDPWKNKIQLFNEKKSENESIYINEWMRRGMELESSARELLGIKVGKRFYQQTILLGWQMASLDAMSECGNIIAEIKCPGKKDHEITLSGKVIS